MGLPDSYTVKFNAIPAYFDAILEAQAPERFSLKFLENLGFSSTNDRLLIGILKDLGFLNRDGAPEKRYFDFLDRSQSKRVLAEAIRQPSQIFSQLMPGQMNLTLKTQRTNCARCTLERRQTWSSTA
jgi:hypothetical protein